MKKILLITGIILTTILLTALLQKLDPADNTALTQQQKNPSIEAEKKEIVDNPIIPAENKEAETLILLVF